MSTLSRRSIAAVAALLISACADSTAPSRALTTDGAAADRHGGKNNQQNQNEAENQNENEQNDQNKNNQNNNDTRTRTTISLAAPATGAAIMGAMGSARLETRGTQMKLEIEVEHVPAGTVVNLFVGGTMVGSATANALGEAELELETNVPAIAKGTVVSAQTTTGGTIVSGSF